MQEDPPPVEPGAFEDFAARLDGPELHRLVRKVEPLTDPVRFRIGSSIRRRYEDTARLPEGFIAIGDSLCCFNPAYGQGITVAALCAQWLADCLDGGNERLTSRYFAGAAKIVDPAWHVSVGGDLRFPHVEGTRTPKMRWLNAYLSKLHRAAERDPVVGRRFLEVANMLTGPEKLIAPSILWRVARQFRRAA